MGSYALARIQNTLFFALLSSTLKTFVSIFLNLWTHVFMGAGEPMPRLARAMPKLIEELTAGYADKATYFVEGLSLGVATIGAAFYPKPVVVRMSDFKSNEYASLVGGAAFEPKEENPMIGFRGASRYAHPAYADAFALERLSQNLLRAPNRRSPSLKIRAWD